MRNMEMDDEGIERSRYNKIFRLGKALYVCKEKVKFPILMKTDKDGIMKEKTIANLIDSDEVTFLCGEETLVEWKTTLYFGRRKLEFKEKKKEVPLIKESHLLVKLERGDGLIKNIQGWADLVKNSEPKTIESPPPGDKSSHNLTTGSSGESPKQALSLIYLTICVVVS